MPESFDIAVIGSGPAGYVAAIRAAQLGKSVAIIEKRATLGGTCLNVGCIPSKALLDSSEKYELVSHNLGAHGISVKGVELDLPALLARKDKVVADVCNGVDFLMKKNKIRRYQGFARFASATEIEILTDAGTETILAQNTIIASGSVPVDLPGIEIDGRVIVTSDHAINLPKVPKHLIIIGAGVIGLELGSVWRRLGAKVTILEFLPGLFGKSDRQMAKAAQKVYESQGLEFRFETKVTGAKVQGKGVQVAAAASGGSESVIEGDVLLVSVGRRPFTDGMMLEKAGVVLNERRRIQVDPHTFRTSVPNIYAIGDVIDGPMLAHKASEEGVSVAEIIAGQKPHINYEAIPWVVYTWPEIAWVGYGEEELKEKGIAYKTGKSFFKPNGRAKAMNETEGFVKILAEEKTGRILGAHILGANASELIAEMAIAMEFGASAEDIARSSHAHPTLAEIMKDAAEAAAGFAIHQ